MKKIIMGFMAGLMSITLLSPAIISNADSLSDAGVTTYAWPGRPGGNEGREEWGGGLSYGQTNGEWVLRETTKGNVDSLNKGEGVGRSVVYAILGLIPESKLVGGSITFSSIFGDMFVNGPYKGTYYIADTYSSGRSIKTIITTYSDQNYRNKVDTYTHIQKW